MNASLSAAKQAGDGDDVSVMPSCSSCVRKRTLRAQQGDAATPAGDAAIDTASSAQVKMVEAETDDLPVKHFMAPRNQYGQLCMDSIKEYLAGSGQTLVSIGQWLSCMQR